MTIFHIKLDALLNDLTKKHVLGRVHAFTAMKEDQKRGLPHCHILLILSDANKPCMPSDIDRIVSAEIPDKEVNVKLWGVISKQNIHSPCGSLNPSSRCMGSEGPVRSCEKNFPKPFKPTTGLTDSTYPEYRCISVADRGQQLTKTVHLKPIGAFMNSNTIQVSTCVQAAPALAG